MKLRYRHEPGTVTMPIVPARWAPPDHDTMARYERCPALKIAAQRGWWVLNPQTFMVFREYDGYPTIEPEVDYVTSHIGGNVFLITVPYSFATPVGWSLLFRQPPTRAPHGTQLFDHIVETDWVYMVTVLLCRIDVPQAIYHEGDPLAMLVPVRRGELQEFTVEETPWQPDTADHWVKDWSSQRIKDYLDEPSIRLAAP